MEFEVHEPAPVPGWGSVCRLREEMVGRPVRGLSPLPSDPLSRIYIIIGHIVGHVRPGWRHGRSLGWAQSLPSDPLSRICSLLFGWLAGCMDVPWDALLPPPPPPPREDP